MNKYQKILIKVLSGKSDQNIAFADLTYLLSRLDFNRRIKGDHCIFYKDGIKEIINLQPIGNKAKPYQVKQVRNIILTYKLGDISDE